MHTQLEAKANSGYLEYQGLAHTDTHLTNLVKLWNEPRQTDNNGFKQNNIFLVLEHGLLQDLEGLCDEQCGSTVRLADDAKHEEGTTLERRVVEESSSVGVEKRAAFNTSHTCRFIVHIYMYD